MLPIPSPLVIDFLPTANFVWKTRGSEGAASRAKVGRQFNLINPGWVGVADKEESGNGAQSRADCTIASSTSSIISKRASEVTDEAGGKRKRSKQLGDKEVKSWHSSLRPNGVPDSSSPGSNGSSSSKASSHFPCSTPSISSTTTPTFNISKTPLSTTPSILQESSSLSRFLKSTPPPPFISKTHQTSILSFLSFIAPPSSWSSYQQIFICAAYAPSFEQVLNNCWDTKVAPKPKESNVSRLAPAWGQEFQSWERMAYILEYFWGGTEDEIWSMVRWLVENPEWEVQKILSLYQSQFRCRRSVLLS